jgi:hypothetical protein
MQIKAANERKRELQAKPSPNRARSIRAVRALLYKKAKDSKIGQLNPHSVPKNDEEASAEEESEAEEKKPLKKRLKVSRGKQTKRNSELGAVSKAHVQPMALPARKQSRSRSRREMPHDFLCPITQEVCVTCVYICMGACGNGDVTHTCR